MAALLSDHCIIILPQHYSRKTVGKWTWLFLERKHLKWVQDYQLVRCEMINETTVDDDSAGGWGQEWWQTGGREVRGGGQTRDGVLTIPWVISQLSMGSSWSAGLSSPFTLSWINNRTTPYTREERAAGPTTAQNTVQRKREREREKGRSQICNRWLHLKVE